MGASCLTGDRFLSDTYVEDEKTLFLTLKSVECSQVHKFTNSQMDVFICALAR